MNVTEPKNAAKHWYSMDIKSAAYGSFNPHDATVDGSDIFHLANTMLGMSGFVYKFYQIRSTVLAHNKKSYPSDMKPKTLVDFDEPALIIQDDSSNKGRPDRNLKHVITPQAIINFFEKNNCANQKYLKIENGKVVFDKDFDKEQSATPKRFDFLEEFKTYESENIKILDYVSHTSSNPLLLCSLIKRGSHNPRMDTLISPTPLILNTG